MGMDVGSKGNSMATMNVVPLIDILLVLIIIFMVITPLTPKGLDTLIPQPAKTDPPNSEPITKTIVVQVFDTGKLKINEEDTTWDSQNPLVRCLQRASESRAFVQGEDGVRCSEVARAIDIMHGSGVEKSGVDNCQAGRRPVVFNYSF